jgi:hypothetical protein
MRSQKELRRQHGNHSGWLLKASLVIHKAVEEILKAYRMTGCNTSQKIHFLYSHLDFFPNNLEDISKKHGEIFHRTFQPQEIATRGNEN